jgi:hypothetical protein
MNVFFYGIACAVFRSASQKADVLFGGLSVDERCLTVVWSTPIGRIFDVFRALCYLGNGELKRDDPQ